MVYVIAADCTSLDRNNECRHPLHRRRLFPLGWLLGRRPACVFYMALMGPDGRDGIVCLEQTRTYPEGRPPPPVSFRSSVRPPR